MECIKCGKESTKKDRGVSGGRCSACYQAFVTEPMEHGLTDMAIKLAEDELSGHGRIYFSKDSLKYQLQRLFIKRIQWCNIGMSVLLIIAVGLSVMAVMNGGFFVKIAMISGVLVLVPLVIKANYKKFISQLDVLVDKWITVNPHDKLLTAEKYQASLGGRPPSNLDEMAFKQVLICERSETVALLLSNLFHVHYGCHVLSGQTYPEGVNAEILSRLKQNPSVKVFLLHDYSPAGHAFVRRIKTDAKWFGGQRVEMIDLGLNANQKKLFNGMTSKQLDRNKKMKETAEIALFSPDVLMTRCGVAIKESVALDLISTAVDAE